MQLHIHHETRYIYEEPVSYSIQTLKLTPRPDPGQRIVNWRVSAPGEKLEQVDPYGNLAHVVTVEQPHREMWIVVDGVADVGEDIAAAVADTGSLSPLAYLAPTTLTRPDRALRDLADRCFGRHPPSRAALLDLVEGIRAAVTYEPGVTDVTHSAAEALELGVGVCQDQTHVLLACCRCAGLPARYVSGYFHSGHAGEVASHAWADVWLGAEQGWVSLDVTHAEQAGARHCRLAVGRDYLDAAPVRGVRRGGGHEAMTVAVKVTSGQAQQQ
ncbi:MAG: transglutaminase family protein [Gammaproteobacteria bacterium]|nr:transglutaminase family protein [Gammaproteobacteria bacterium]